MERAPRSIYEGIRLAVAQWALGVLLSCLGVQHPVSCYESQIVIARDAQELHKAKGPVPNEQHRWIFLDCGLRPCRI